MSDIQTTTVQMEVPISLFAQAQNLIEAGWFRSFDEIMLDALRRFLEAHRAELLEEFIQQDVEWGLTGSD